MSMNHLFNMGGYGLYVWPAYCITLFVLGFNFFLVAREKKHIKKMLHRLSRQSL